MKARSEYRKHSWITFQKFPTIENSVNVNYQLITEFLCKVLKRVKRGGQKIRSTFIKL